MVLKIRIYNTRKSITRNVLYKDCFVVFDGN